MPDPRSPIPDSRFPKDHNGSGPMSVIRPRLMYLLIALAAALAGLAVFVRWVEPRFAFFPFSGETETPRDFGIPYEALTIETKDGERLRAWLMTAPSPRARIVYFHG